MADRQDAGEYEEMAGYRPLLPKQEQQLDKIGVNARDFWCFVAHFVGHPFDYIEMKPGQDEWRLVSKRRLANATLIRHLSGELVIGTGCRWDASRGSRGRHVTTYIAVDLDLACSVDARSSESARRAISAAWYDLLHRYDAVVRALGHPSVLLRSSGSGGVHLYYLFADPVELHQLRDPESVHGAVVRLLAAYGVPEKSGRIEVYPRGQYRRRGPQTRLRLPFGRESMALDPFTLDRLTRGSPADDLRHLSASLRRGVVSFAEPEEWLEEAKQLPPVVKRRNGKRRLQARHDGTRSTRSSNTADAKTVWRTGLTANRQFNGAVWTLGWDLRCRGLSVEAARSKIIEWLDEKHNGCSRTYNASHVIAYKEIQDILGRLYSKAGPTGDWGVLPGLSEWEAKGLIEATRHDHQISETASGVVLSRFKVQHLGFELLRHGKQWVLREVRWRVANLRAAQPDLNPDSVEFAQVLAPQLASFWPDRTRPFFIVPVPFKLRLAIEGVGKDSQWALWRVLQDQEVCVMERSASAEAHRAATYRLALDFAALSATNVTFNSLPSALSTLLEPDEIRRLYTRHYAGRIRKAHVDQSLTVHEDDALAVIRKIFALGALTSHVHEAA